ncbi:DUF305 domain-containing protein [Tersicoccus mangrovi]|uniref:DUF305 domain-containing protein n=1 Tax=Tersicoccus mangrovi TaxID=3121635 RepID=UPI002FE5C359
MTPVRPTSASRRCRSGLAALGVAAVTVLLATGCAGGTDASSDHSGHAMSGMVGMTSTTSAPATAGASASSTTSSSAHNDADVMFAQMMIPHHQQAVQLSDIILAKTGVKPQVTALAKKIKAAQAPEITTMTGWLSSWGAPATTSAHRMGMSGMVSDNDVKALRDADGTTASSMFLAQMIGHHEGAVAMAKDEVATGQNQDGVGVARRVITSQSAEIAQMKAMLQAS